MESLIPQRVRVVWRYGLAPGSPAALSFAFGCVVFATLMRYGLGFVLSDPSTIVFEAYYPAILIATLVGGAAAGAFALVVSGLYAWWAFMPPHYAFLFVNADQGIKLLVYATAGSLVLAAAESYRRLAHLYYETEHRNRLVIDELNHRVRNKLATVQAILGFELKDNKEVWDAISRRLAAIIKTDDLIIESNGRGAELADILKAELLPYGDTALSRTACNGDPIMLPPKLAVSLALVLHELATNAAKYGALSVPDGRIAINWTADSERIEMSWVESGGPRVSPPSRQGFGSKLFRVALEPFAGRVEHHFDAGGLRCDIAWTLPKDYFIPTFLADVGQQPTVQPADARMRRA